VTPIPSFKRTRHKPKIPAEKANRLRSLESNLEHRIIDARKTFKDAGALMHLKGGLGCRHYILRHCREYIERTCFTSTDKPLSAETATEAALHLNGYYLNLRGALDNLAWMLQMEIQVFPSITESSSGRRNIDLFGKLFLDTLEKKSSIHARPIIALKQWGLDLAKFRDPAAHRIPLYVPPGIMTSQEQVAEFRRLDELSGASEDELGGERRIEIMLEAQRVGSFTPVFCVTSRDGIQLYSIPGQVIFDHRRYLHLARKVLEAFQ
jgi:hypothetical protein